MSCTNPLYALDLGVKEDGKRNIKILPQRADLYSLAQLEHRYGKNAVLPLPCGKCLACRLSKAREWAVRCVLEASLYDENCFLTLTYDDEHLPEDLKVHREHIQEFCKRLRASGIRFRYFGCGEYGSDVRIYNGHGRPHYHLIIFGWCPSDIKKCTSNFLSKIWQYGFNFVDDCNFNTCQYVARYTTKKIYSNKNLGEFLCMSLKPGIGAGWFEKHPDVINRDSIYGSFGVAALPRYFEKIALSKGFDLSSIKDERIDKASDIKLHEMIVHALENVEDLYSYKGEIQLHDFKRKGERKSL